jgi:hypothetical protein
MSVGDGVRASVHEAPAGNAGALTMDRTSVALFVVLVLAAALYLWTAGTTVPLALSGAESDPYNQLANAFLHFHLSVGPAPAGLLGLAEPYNPSQNGAFQGLTGPLQLGIHDFSLYQGKLFLSWGPAPVIVLLVPLHLLGLEPASSVTVSLFAIAGLGFALAALRVVLRAIGGVPVWMCVLAASTLALSSAVPFILRRPEVYEEAVSAGYCFAMAAIWLAISALAGQRASLRRLAIMSLCIGLAAGSRPTLALIAVVLVPVYMSLRTVHPRRGLLIALLIPAGVCALLLLAYNQARFGNPLENGVTYQLGGVDQNTARFGDASYVPPGLWFYALSPPRAEILFPFISLTRPPVSYPGSLPGFYPQELEPTGGLLAMAPIVVFLAALPRLWRRRTTSLGRLPLPLLVLAGAGMACMLFLSYTFFATTERYEVDFATLFLLGALAAWLALSNDARGWRRRLVRIAGGVLAIWGCVAGLAISFTGYYNLLATAHPGTWKLLEDVTSPISRAAAMLEGHPVLAEVTGPHFPLVGFGEQIDVTIVSPDTRRAVLLATWTPTASAGATAAPGRPSSALLVRGPGRAGSTYRIRPGGEPTRIPVSLTAGLNRLSLTPLVPEAGGGASAVEGESQSPLLIRGVSLAPES